MLAKTGVIASVDEDIDGNVLVMVIVDPSGFVLVSVPIDGVVGADEKILGARDRPDRSFWLKSIAQSPLARHEYPNGQHFSSQDGSAR